MMADDEWLERAKHVMSDMSIEGEMMPLESDIFFSCNVILQEIKECE